MRISLDNVGHAFREGEPLFSGLTSSAGPGELVVLTGPSGSGKSTLLSLLAGWEVPTHGAIRLHDIHRVQWVFQNPHGNARRTAVDHVALPLLARGYSQARATSEAQELLRAFDLAATGTRQFADLSGGQAQRLMLARAVATDADLLLVDEPTAQLDHKNAATVVNVLRSLCGPSRIVVVATHDPSVRRAATTVWDLSS